jgi:signal transduction histidine kinase/FixJ family two-component response regulator
MTIRRFIKVLFAVLASIAIISAVLIGWAAVNRRALVRLLERQFVSYQLADELRHSSDELTRFARTYVVTGDRKYERYYRGVEGIRNGTLPRPANYDRVYWDFHIDRGADSLPPGPPISLMAMMARAGFASHELAGLARALGRSDSLVAIEETAMHAVRGEYRDASGAFTRRGRPNQALAIRMMHDSTYHHAKARIMAPIDSVLGAEESHAANELAAFRQATGRALLIIQSLLAAFLLVVLVSYPMLRWKVLLPVRGLSQKTGLVAADIERLAAISTRIAQGDLSQSFDVSTTPIGSDRRDEIGDLSRLHDSMVEELQNTGHAIAALTADLRKAKEAAESASRAKGAFLAHMSHEIRTPMNAILGYAQLLQVDAALDKHQRRKVTAIHTSGDHLLGLLNDVLEMSRIEAGRMTLSAQPFDLHALLDSVRSMFTELTSQRGLRFAVQMPPDLVRGLQSDPGKVRQVLINLLGNATKFTDRGGITVRVASREVGVEQCQVTMEVEDTGPGIPPDALEMIFTAFGQAEAGRQRAGTGLGLTISRSMALFLGGDLTVRSTVGQGSTFTFTFIATRVPDAALADTSPAHGPQRLDPAETRRKALVVDDVPSNRELAQESLSRAGFQTRGAATGEEGIEVYRSWGPDLVLMDLHMPGMGGMAAIKVLREADSEAVIVVTTAGADDSTEAEASDAGAAGFLRKPYRESELFETLGRAMGVRFIEVEGAAAPADTERPDLAVLVRQIPADLIAELREACRQARSTRLVQLADRVAEHSGDAAEAIRELAGSFRYRVLLEALEGAKDGKP